METYAVRLIFVVAIVGFGTGFQIYSLSVVNNVEDIVKDWINQTYINRYGVGLSEANSNVMWSGITCCVMAGACVGAATLSTIAERLGRKYGLALCGFVSILGAAFSGLAKIASSFEMLIFGRLFLGYGLGVGIGLSSLFLTEIAPLRYRGSCGAVVGLFFGLGDFSSIGLTLPQILGTQALWPVAFALPALPALLQLVVVMLCPESPRFLYLTRRNEAKALNSLNFYQGAHYAQISQAELLTEQRQAEELAKKKVSIRKFLIARVYRKRILVTVLLNSASILSGIGAIMSYSTSMLRQAGLPLETAKFASVGIGACNFILPFLTVFTVERMGRRLVSLTGLAGCAVSILCVTIFTAISTYSNVHSKGLSYATVAALICYQIAFGIQQPIVMFLTSELFEQNVRGIGMTLANVVFFSEAMFVLLAYPPFAAAVGVAISFIPCFVCCFGCLVFLFFLLPETKGKSVEHIIASMSRKKVAPGDTATENGRLGHLQVTSLDDPVRESPQSKGGDIWDRF